jgi:hypothetical protein
MNWGAILMDSKNIIEKFEGHMIELGSYNDRIYLIKSANDSPSTTPYSLIDLARKHNYSKTFAHILECHW